MKEVVDEILAAEKEVEKRLSEARQQASGIRQESEQEATAIISAAQATATEHIRATIATARSEAEQSRERDFSLFRKRRNSLLDRNRKTIDSLVNEIVIMITADKTMESR